MKIFWGVEMSGGVKKRDLKSLLFAIVVPRSVGVDTEQRPLSL